MTSPRSALAAPGRVSDIRDIGWAQSILRGPIRTVEWSTEWDGCWMDGLMLRMTCSSSRCPIIDDKLSKTYNIIKEIQKKIFRMLFPLGENEPGFNDFAKMNNLFISLLYLLLHFTWIIIFSYIFPRYQQTNLFWVLLNRYWSCHTIQRMAYFSLFPSIE